MKRLELAVHIWKQIKADYINYVHKNKFIKTIDNKYTQTAQKKEPGQSFYNSKEYETIPKTLSTIHHFVGQT